MDPKVILETVLNREEITAIEALMLMREEGKILHELFEVADSINERINNNVVTYVRSKQVHYTNICRAECSFCSFYRKKGQKGAFSLTPAEIVRQIREAGSIKQVSLQGGLNPDLNLGYHLDVLHGINLQAGLFMSYVGLFSYYSFDNWAYQPSFVSSNGTSAIACLKYASSTAGCT